MAGKPWLQELDAADHMTPTCNKQKRMNACVWLAFFFLCSLRPQPMGGTKCRAALPTLANLVWMTSHRQAQRFVSSMILDPLK